jgi:hypothetical protein
MEDREMELGRGLGVGGEGILRLEKMLSKLLPPICDLLKCAALPATDQPPALPHSYSCLPPFCCKTESLSRSCSPLSDLCLLLS